MGAVVDAVVQQVVRRRGESTESPALSNTPGVRELGADAPETRPRRDARSTMKAIPVPTPTTSSRESLPASSWMVVPHGSSSIVASSVCLFMRCTDASRSGGPTKRSVAMPGPLYLKRSTIARASGVVRVAMRTAAPSEARTPRHRPRLELPARNSVVAYAPPPKVAPTAGELGRVTAPSTRAGTHRAAGSGSGTRSRASMHRRGR